MPRLSLYRPNKSNDYRFLDKSIKEMFTIGATDLLIHKYLGPSDQGPSTDLTKPQNTTLDPTKIQDLLFLENRDRKYAPDIYTLRGHYNVQNLDFDLSQFGLFLNNDIIFITVHYNTMIDVIGRKLMVGDVFELPHLTDYHPLNETLPTSLRRYYQITDANFASEGFSVTWFPHLWRIKCEPLVDSQEFSNILSQPVNKDNYLGDWDKTKTYVPGYTVTYGDKTYTSLSNIDPGVPCTGALYDNTTAYASGVTVTQNGITYLTTQSVPAGTPVTNTQYFTPVWELSTADNLRDILGRYNKNIEINDATIAEAARLVPKNGYDRSQLYLNPTTKDNKPALPVNIVISNNSPTPIRGIVSNIQTAGFSVASPVVRIGAAARDKLTQLSNDDIDALTSFIKLSLETAHLAPERLPSGGGQVKGDVVLAAKSLGAISKPYGTGDNTFSHADQFPNLYFTTGDRDIIPGTTLLSMLTVINPDTPDTWFNNPGIDVGSTITDSNGDQVQVFSDGTKIINVDLINKTFTIDSPTIATIPASSIITVAASFTGNPIEQNVMDYRADADPRFKYIVRISPRGFGYSTGYNSGDGTAPNGIPVGAGISFPSNPSEGDCYLRIDYIPNILYRYDGSLWVRIGTNDRASAGMNQAETQLGTFINNSNVTVLTNGTTIPEQQPLSSILNLRVD